MLDEPEEAARRACDDGLAAGHRLRAHDAEPLAQRWTDDDGSRAKAPLELLAGEEAEGRRDEVAKRAVPRDDEVHALRRLDELGDPLLGREPPCVEDLERLALAAHARWNVDSVRDEDDVAHPRCARGLGEGLRDADDRTRTVEHGPYKTGMLASEAEVVQEAA